MNKPPSFVPSCLRVSEVLEQHFDTAFAAPDGVAKLRELILTLAMQGKLVEQDPSDPPASELLKEIEAEKKKVSREGAKARRGKEKNLPPITPEEVPYELPQGWEWVRLPECYFGVGNKSNQIQTKDYRESGKFPVVDQGKNFITGYSDDESKLLHIDRPVIVFGDHTKNIKFVDFDFIIGADGVKVLCPFKGVSTKFLYRLIQSFDLTDRGYARHFKVLNEKLAPLPPLREQHRIVARIDQLMARCDALEKLRKQREEKRLSVHAAAIKQLLDAPNGSAWDFIQQHFDELYTVKENVNELRRAILQLAVMSRLVPQNPNDPPASQLLKEIEAEKQRLVKAGKIKKPKPMPPIKPEEVPYQLPQGWEWCRMQDIFLTLKYGTSKKCDYDGGAIPVLRIPNISNGRISIDDLKFTDLSEKEKNDLGLDEDDLLIIRSNGSESLVGRAAVVGKEASGFCYAGYLMRIRSNKKLVNSYYLYLVFDCEMTRSAIEGPIRTTSGVKNVNSTEISQLKVPLPPLQEQHRIVARINQMMALCDNLDQQIGAATGKQTELLNAVMAEV